MYWFKKIKAFIRKENTDYSQGYIDPFEFHKTFFWILKAFKVTDIDSEIKPTFFNQNFVIFIFGFLASAMIFMSLLHAISNFDVPHMTESGTYFIILAYELLIISCTKQNLPQYHNFLKTMKKDFEFICTIGEKYREQFFANQLLTWKICIIVCIYTAGLSIGMNLFAYLSLFYYLATNTPEDRRQRPMLFPVEIYNVDLLVSPIYEVVFCFLNICVVLYAYNYIFMLQTQIVWVRHITSKADIVIWSIEDLLVGVHPATNRREKIYFCNLIQQRIRDIVIQHQSMYSLLEDYAHVYKKLLMYEQLFAGPVICLTAYCTFEKLQDGEFNAILALLSVGTTGMYFIPSYLCTYLAVKISSICDACWNIPFWNADPIIRTYMVLIMQRSQRPSPLCAPGFEDISIRTFSRKMSSAYSCFNMLRHANL